MRKVCVALSSVVLLLTVLALAPLLDAQAHASIQPASTNSSVWAGYAITASTITTVTGTFTLPQVDCTSYGRTDMAFWVGIDGFNTPTVEQTGVEAACGPDGLVYKPWYETFPQPAVYIDQSAAAGDHFTVTVQRAEPHTYALTLQDTTTPWTYTTTQTAQDDADATAEWIVERGSRRVPSFDQVSFENCAADGKAIGTYDTATAVTLQGRTSLTPSALNASGNAFSIASTTASAPQMPTFPNPFIHGWPQWPQWPQPQQQPPWPTPHNLGAPGGGGFPQPWLGWAW
jgi:hypothetical protein